MVNAINIALSGLQAAGKKLGAAASNIANLNTTGALDEANGRAPYSALTSTQNAQTIAGEGSGVQANIVQKDPGFVPAFDPNSPFADEDGFIGVPNVNLAEEAVNLKLAETTYKANIKTLQASQNLSDELFRIFDDDA